MAEVSLLKAAGSHESYAKQDIGDMQQVKTGWMFFLHATQQSSERLSWQNHRFDLHFHVHKLRFPPRLKNWRDEFKLDATDILEHTPPQLLLPSSCVRELYITLLVSCWRN